MPVKSEVGSATTKSGYWLSSDMAAREEASKMSLLLVQSDIHLCL